MNSALYSGWVRHHRFLPREHRFQYRISMLLLDLSELDSVFRGKWFWSIQKRNLVSFWRKDHYGNADEPLDESIRNLVEERLGKRPQGAVRLLTNPRYFGFAMNPVSFYYCFDSQDQVESIVAEVNNTPWGEQHCYVFPVNNRNRNVHRFEFHKDFHVSPFMSMDQDYDWRIGEPRSRVAIHMKNIEEGKTMLHATLSLQRFPLTSANLATSLMRFPFMTGKVFAGIYWNALKLYLKKIPFYPHPRKSKESDQTSAELQLSHAAARQPKTK